LERKGTCNFMDFIAIDFETANSNRSSICSIGLAFVENGRLTGSDHILVRPTPDYYDYSIQVFMELMTK